jgi:uncharacterized damage-inducible protein DinB
MSSKAILEEIKTECLRRINEEGIFRIQRCLGKLTFEQVWHKPNEHTNSIGNLILHLEGNINQWILSTLGNKQDNRNREEEFNTNNKVGLKELTSRLNRLEKEIQETIIPLNEDRLIKSYNVQCYKESGISIIIHAIEHFSYHVGQITLQTKLFIDEDLSYYSGQNLTKTN